MTIPSEQPEPPTPGRQADEPRRGVAAVLMLNAATGVVEAVSFAHLGGIFAAFVTGTVVLAGLHLATGGVDGLLPYGIAFLGLVLGSALGGVLTRSARGDGTPAALGVRAIRRALIGEIAALLVAAAFSDRGDLLGRLVALGCLAMGMAMQFSATKRLNVADVGFAALTGLIHGLVQDLAQGRVVRLPRRVLAVLTILAGATIGGVVSRASIPAALAIALVLVGITTLLVSRTPTVWDARPARSPGRAS